MKLKDIINESKHQKRPIEFYQDAWKYFNDSTEGTKTDRALDAFKKAGKKHNVTLSGCMSKRENALSYMQDDVKRKVQ